MPPHYPTDEEKAQFNSGKGGSWMSETKSAESRLGTNRRFWWLMPLAIIGLFAVFALCVAYV